jgi:hypothetical protein
LAHHSTIDPLSRDVFLFVYRFVVVVAVIQSLDPIVPYQSSFLSGLFLVQQLKQSPAAAADSSSSNEIPAKCSRIEKKHL